MEPLRWGGAGPGWATCENRPPHPPPARVSACVTAGLGEDPGPEELMPGPRGDGLTFESAGASCGGPWPPLPGLPVALIMTVIPFCYMTRPIDSIFPRRSSRAEFYVYNSLNKRQSMKQHVPDNPVSSEFFFLKQL